MTNTTITADAKIEEFIKKQKMLVSIIKSDRAAFEKITFDQDCDGYCGWDDDDNIDLIMSKYNLSADDAVRIANYMRMARIDMLSFALKGADAAAAAAANFAMNENPKWDGVLSEDEIMLTRDKVYTFVHSDAYETILAQVRKHLAEYVEHIMFTGIRRIQHG